MFLDFDNVVSEQELETILETMEETATHKTLEHNEQPEISEDEEVDSEGREAKCRGKLCPRYVTIESI